MSTHPNCSNSCHIIFSIRRAVHKRCDYMNITKYYKHEYGVINNVRAKTWRLLFSYTVHVLRLHSAVC